MKVTELFEAVQGEPGQGGKHRGGAYYPPSYDADSKMLRGSVLDWMDSAGITKDDIAKAVEQIKKDPLIAKLADQGLKLIEKPASEKNGTLNFSVTRQYQPDGKKHKGSYQVHANGQIRASGDSWFAAHQGKLKSPKPRLKAGDSVGSLLMIYKNALQELLDKKKKDIVKEAKAGQEQKSLAKEIETVLAAKNFEYDTKAGKIADLLFWNDGAGFYQLELIGKRKLPIASLLKALNAACEKFGFTAELEDGYGTVVNLALRRKRD